MTYSLPDRIETPPPRLKSVGYLFASLCFVGIGAFMLREGGEPLVAWAGIGFFGICAIGYLAMMFGRVGVLLEYDKLEVRTLFWRRSYAWRDVSEFVLMARGAAILFNHNPPGGPQRDVTIPAAIVSGKIAAMCATLNAFRTRAIFQPNPSP